MLGTTVGVSPLSVLSVSLFVSTNIARWEGDSLWSMQLVGARPTLQTKVYSATSTAVPPKVVNRMLARHKRSNYTIRVFSRNFSKMGKIIERHALDLTNVYAQSVLSVLFVGLHQKIIDVGCQIMYTCKCKCRGLHSLKGVKTAIKGGMKIPPLDHMQKKP